jgi:hypothetical protein
MAHHGKLNRTKITTNDQAYHKLRRILRKQMDIIMRQRSPALNATRWHEYIKLTSSASDTLVNFCQTTWRYKLQYSHLHTRRRHNLKSYTINIISETLVLS